MDSRTFDHVTRFVARAASRRESLRSAAALIAAAAAQSGLSPCPAAAAACSDKTCKKDQDCCSGICEISGSGSGKGVCRCVRKNDPCSKDSDCCQSGSSPLVCAGGVCAKPARCIKLKRSCTTRDTCCDGVCTSSGSGICCIPMGVPGCRTSRDCCPDSGVPACFNGSCTMSPSDVRLKQAIAPLDGNLAAVEALRPVRWAWTDASGLGRAPQIGFIAQEVRDVVPEVVARIGDAPGGGNYLGIDYAKLVAVLTGAVQEQQAEIASLNARLAAMEATAAGVCRQA